MSLHDSSMSDQHTFQSDNRPLLQHKSRFVSTAVHMLRWWKNWHVYRLVTRTFRLLLSLSLHWLFTSIRVNEWVNEQTSECVWFSWWKLQFLCYYRTSAVIQPHACFKWKQRENLSRDIVTGGSYHYEAIKRYLRLGRYCSFRIYR
jgi:hypothetical protein